MVVAPPTVKAPSSVLSPRARNVPSTSRRAVGAAAANPLPMPTKPASAPMPPNTRIRSMSLVRIAKAAGSRVPRKLLAGLVLELPVTAQALSPISAEIATCDNTPVLSERTMRSRAPTLVVASPPSVVTVVAPATIKASFSVAAPPTVSKPFRLAVPSAAILTWSVSTPPTRFWTRNRGAVCVSDPWIVSEPPPVTEPMLASPVAFKTPLTVSGSVWMPPPAPMIMRTTPLVTRRRSTGSPVPT